MWYVLRMKISYQRKFPHLHYCLYSQVTEMSHKLRPWGCDMSHAPVALGMLKSPIKGVWHSVPDTLAQSLQYRLISLVGLKVYMGTIECTPRARGFSARIRGSDHGNHISPSLKPLSHNMPSTLVGG